MDKDLLRIRKVVEKEFAVFQQRFSDSLVADSKLIQDVFTFIKNKKGNKLSYVGFFPQIMRRNKRKQLAVGSGVGDAAYRQLLHDDVVDETLNGVDTNRLMLCLQYNGIGWRFVADEIDTACVVMRFQIIGNFCEFGKTHCRRRTVAIGKKFLFAFGS